MKDIVDQAVEIANAATEDIAHNVGGITSTRIRTLLNLLVARLPADEAYLEVGIHIGGTLISALHGHRSARAYACDNWSYQESNAGDPRKVFYENLERNRSELPDVTIFEQDCFRLFKGTPFDRPIGAYFYDGGHSAEEQRMAVLHAAPHLANESVMVVDDFGWADVWKGTWEGIREAGFRRVVFRALVPESKDDRRWHNGIGLFHFSK